MKHVASCSFGKDSLATILLALMHSEPLDEVVYCEVMFDDAISGEVPEHRDFIYGRAIPFLERNGIKVVVLRSEMTYIRSFYRILQKGQSAGKLNSWPLCGKCCIQRDCKLPPIRAYYPEGTGREHCGNPGYNATTYTHEMLMEDWGQGRCRFWTPKIQKGAHDEKQLFTGGAQPHRGGVPALCRSGDPQKQGTDEGGKAGV